MASGKVQKRARAVRREAEREARKLAEAREKLFRLEAGGAPERPIEVASSSVVEPLSRDRPCPRCGAALRVEEHAARTIDGARLREARVRCTACASARSLWFRLVSAEPS